MFVTLEFQCEKKTLLYFKKLYVQLNYGIPACCLVMIVSQQFCVWCLTCAFINQQLVTHYCAIEELNLLNISLCNMRGVPKILISNYFQFLEFTKQ